jgi:hypothetical protein
MSDSKTFDEFWLDKGQDLVTNTIKNLNQHLTNYRIYLDALTGLYLLGGATAQAFYQSTNLIVYLCFIIPMVFVQIGRYRISVGQKVDLEGLDIRSPIKINDAHNKLVLSLKMGIDRAKSAMFYATVLVVIGAAVGMYNLNIDNKLKEEEKMVKEREKELVKMDDEILKDAKKSQKLEFSLSEKKVLIMDAKFIEPTTVQIIAINEAKDTLKKEVVAPANTSFKYQLNKIEEIIDVKILTEN